VITAIVLVHVVADRIPEAAQAIADLEGVDEVYSCAGDVDLIAIVKVAEHEQLADVVAGRLSKVEGVRRTDTHIAFRSWSRADTEATFSVGLET
jgi:DNA-binding Lrp family transcriptional regulator